jgi:hypothetical protein
MGSDEKRNIIWGIGRSTSLHLLISKKLKHYEKDLFFPDWKKEIQFPIQNIRWSL